jgi:guanylate kinase
MFFVLSAPSGAGKTTIARAVMQRLPVLSFSVSATTRARRPVETDGVDYHFYSKADFMARAERGEFVEWEEVFGNCYGTPRSELERAEREGRHLLFDIDVKGALSIKRHFPASSLLIFIQPPNFEVLRQRLLRRRTDSEDVVQTRLARAAWELEQAPLFDRVVVNDDLARAIDAVADIITGAAG